MNSLFSVWRTLLVMLMLLWAAPGVQALDGTIALKDLHHDIWTGKDGAPAQVQTMTQTSDGWLWIGSIEGLFRFDGVRFQRFEPLPGETLPKRPVTSLSAMRNGDLLIGYLFGGLSVLHQGRLRHLPDMVGDAPIGPVSSAILDHTGELWVGTSSALLQLRQGAWHNVGPELGLPKGRISNLVEDQYDQLWISVGDTLFVRDPGEQRFRPVLHGAHTVNLIHSPDGRMWQDLHHTLIPVPPQHQGPLMPRPVWLARQTAQENGLFDRDGNYWSLGCPVGICRSEGVGRLPSKEMQPNSGPRSQLDQPWQMSSLNAIMLFEDRDGNIWVGTQTGLERFRHNRLLPVEFPGGERFFSAARDDAGRVLVLGWPTGAMWRLGPRGPEFVERSFKPGFTGVIGNGADGALLLARGDRIERRYRGAVEHIDYPHDPDNTEGGGDAPVIRIFDDGAGLWVRITRRGSFRLEQGRWRSQAEMGLPPGNFFGTPGVAKGTAWLGYNDGRIVHFDNGRLTTFQPAPADAIGPVTLLHAGPEVVAGGGTGLAVLQGQRFRRLTADQPEAITGVSGMVVGANGDRWLNGGKGMVLIKAADWKAALAKPGTVLKTTVYGVLDGYPGLADVNSRDPSAIMDANGQIWAFGTGGMARLDTGRDDPLPHPPQVKIEALVDRGGRHLDFSAPVVLDAGTTAFRIEYTALSYSLPQLVKFRYQLEGVDADWQEAGERRAASYTNLGPGVYRFRVAAVNELGQWNREGSAITLRILPTFTQTPLFYVLCGLAAAGLLYLLYRLWHQQAMLRIAERMAERERIARVLHDTFLQSVHGLVLGFQNALDALPGDSGARVRMERVLLLADRVIEEGRDEVQELRSSAMSDGDLQRGLTVVGEVLQEGHGGLFSLRREGTPRVLVETVACEIYSIGREALLNAFRHAGAKSITVTVRYEAHRFTLLVADDGKGLAPEVRANGRLHGHWGLPGMAERARRVGGELALDGGEPGTVVKLTIPAALAYAGQSRWKRLLASLRRR